MTFLTIKAVNNDLKSYENFFTNPDHNISRLLFDKIFKSQQMKRIVIISNRHGTCDLPYELSNNLRLQTVGGLRSMKKISKHYRVI